jgi:hypothetical protein
LLTGAAVPDLTYYGNDGDDFMTGGDGDDLIYGGAGNNVLDGAGNTGDVCVTHLGATDVRRRCELGDKSTAPVCVPAAVQCAASGAARVQTCENDGNWSYGSLCTGGTPSCSAGACVP